MLKKNTRNTCFFALCVIVFFFTSTINYGQEEASNWYFGRNAGVNFNNGSIQPLEDGAIQTNEGCASISNNKGELLFYTDGILVWDKSHNVMPNGSDLLGHKSSTQSAVIVPKPNSDSIYYIFTVINSGNVEGVRYSEVDMTLNSGNGDVTSNKNILLATPSTEKISAVKHANGIDYWVATHGWNSNEFSVFKVTENGVDTTAVKSSVGSYHGTISFNCIGYMKFSPNGKRLALAKWSTDSVVEVFDFDSSTGVISNPIILDNFFAKDYENGAYGIEFSLNSNLLYVTEINLSTYVSKLHQFDLTDYNKQAIINSNILVYEGRDILAAVQLAPDGKIYVCNAFSRYLSVINNPNSMGSNCNYERGAVSLGSRSAVYGLPSFIQSVFVANIEIDNSCLGAATQFSIKTDEPIDDILWDFGDSVFSNEEMPMHDYLTTGVYIVKAKIKSGNCILNVTKEVVIYESPVAYKAEDYIICEDSANDGFESFNLKSKDGEILGSQSDADFQVSYFESLEDAEANESALNSQIINKKNYQKIYARVSNRLNIGCYDVSSFLLIIETAIARNVKDLNLCINRVNAAKLVVDLNQFDDEIYSPNVVTPYSDYIITYHLSQFAADSAIDVLVPENFEIKNNSVNIYARLENSEAGCFTTTNFKIIISEATAHQPLDLYLCDDASNDGKEFFDLASQKTAILQSQTGKVTFHASQSDADSGNLPLDENFENQSPSQTIFVRVENPVNASCYDTTSFYVGVSSQPTAGTVADYMICDDQSNDGKEVIDLSQFDALVYNGQSTTNYTVTYHETQADADLGVNTLPLNYESTSQDLFARIENTGSSIICHNTTRFNIIIDQALTAHQPLDLYLCDDASNDGKEFFDLASQKPAILQSQTGNVTFHASQSDADSGNLPLDENFENQSLSQTIFVRVENPVNASCYDTTSFYVGVSSQPTAGTVADYMICDDQSNDGKEVIDLSQFDALVYNGQSTTNYTVTYHETQADADLGVNTLPLNYESTSQDLFARIENTGSSIICHNTTRFNIIIDQALTAHQPLDLYLCDDASNDGKEFFDLASQKPAILQSQTGNVTFHASQSDADSGNLPLDENFENQSLSQAIFVRVENPVNASCYDTTSFYIGVSSQPTAGTVADYMICDDQSNDGKEVIDLSQFDALVYNAQSTTNYTVTYHETQADADLGVNTLPLNYESTSQDLFARIENTGSGYRSSIICHNTTKFNIIIDIALTAHQPSDMYLCDDASNDGKEFFDLASQKTAILQSQTGNVTFHASQSDADSGNLPLDENFENQSPSQAIFVRVENPVNTSCYDTTSFYIGVSSQPTAGTVADYMICDDQSNDGKEVIDLSQFDALVYNGQSTTNYTVTYHETQADADLGVITLPLNYESTSQELFARIENTGSSIICHNTTKFNIIIDRALTAHQPSDLYLCDDASNDGKEFFDLASQKPAILQSQTGNVTFHASQSDADSGNLPLDENFENQSPSQTIFVRVENPVNASCYDTTSFYVGVSSQPTAGTVADYMICDDQSNDGKEVIDLSQFDALVYNGQSTTNYTVTYHETQADADLGVNTLPLNYESTSQDLFARIENTGSSIICHNTTKFNIIIDQALTAHQPLDLYLCDDASNDGKEFFDLASQKPAILQSQTGNVTFHASQSDADSGNLPLDENFENQSLSQAIFVRVENPVNASCYDTTSFYIGVSSQPTAGTVADYMICDDQSNDGKEVIDLSQFDALVYNGQSTTNYTVTYHETQADADLGVNTLPLNYESTSQELFARIENTGSGYRSSIICHNTTKFNIIIDIALTAHQPSDMYLCDDASNDGKEFFDLASQKTAILQSQTGNVTFHASQSDADSGNLPLDENFQNQSPSQAIFVRVENPVNTSCYDTTSFYIEVRSQPIVDIIKTWYLCPGEDLQLYVNSIHDEYLWSNGKTDSEITINKAGSYSVTVYNVLQGLSKCGVTETIQVLDTEIPKTVDIIEVDWTANNNSIEVNVDGTENYLFSIDGDVYQSSNVFNNLEAGDYIVYVKNERDCLLYSEDVYLLNYPKFFTPNNDGYNDYWKINFSEKELGIEVHIFDRYGKLITKLNASSEGWDGTFNGQLLATSDYWFVVNRPSKNKQHKGHFTLKR